VYNGDDLPSCIWSSYGSTKFFEFIGEKWTMYHIVLFNGTRNILLDHIPNLEVHYE
jgi:hypothetical protein